MSLEHLCYVSSAVQKLSDQELRAILESAIRHNAANHITGLLLYSEGNFMQILEGTPAALDETIDRIVFDSMHHGVVELFRDPIDGRDFSHWRMGLRTLSSSDLNAHPSCIPFFRPDFDVSKVVNPKAVATEFLLRFRSGN